MIKNNIKKLLNSQKSKEFISKYKIPKTYLSINRDMVTKAFLVGIFIALIPIPMQMLVVVIMMRFVKFNLPLAVTLCWVTNPFTMPFIFYVEYIVGSFVLNIDTLAVQISTQWFSNQFADIFLPLYLGAFVTATVVSSATYILINYLWIYFVIEKKKLHHKERNKR